jgi:hypothetical protein
MRDDAVILPGGVRRRSESAVMEREGEEAYEVR